MLCLKLILHAEVLLLEWYDVVKEIAPKNDSKIRLDKYLLF